MSHLPFDQVKLSDLNLDAFGRLRVSQPSVLFHHTSEYTIADKYNETTAGSGTITHDEDESAFYLNVGTASGDKATREAKKFAQYVPGQSHLIEMTGILQPPKSGVKTKIGARSGGDGVWFESDGSDTKIVISSTTSGSPVEFSIPYSQWELTDYFGHAVSLDFSKAMIFGVDLQWLGVGRVRFFIGRAGKPLVVYDKDHSGQLGRVYMQTARLKCFYEIENTATTASSTSMAQICSTVVTEGMSGLSAVNNTISTGLTAITVSTGAWQPILAIRMKEVTTGGKLIRALWKMADIQVLPSAKKDFYFRISCATINGGTWTDVSATHSFLEYQVSPSVTSIEHNAYGFFANAGNVLNVQGLSALRFAPGEELLIDARVLGATDDIFVVVNAEEEF